MKWIILIFLISCNQIQTGKKGKDEQFIAETQRKCTAGQLTEVDTYFKTCDESSYFSSHCFDRAIVMLCDSI